MTVETTTRKQSFAATQSSLTFTFKVLPDHPEHVKVKKVLTSSGAETDLTYTTDYTVSLESEGVGGVVSIIATVGSLYTYTVYRKTEQLQESDYDDYNQFPADTLETDLDRATCILQEIQEEIDRSVKAPISSSVDIVFPSPDDGEILAWSGTGGTMVNVTYSTTALDAAIAEAENSATTSTTSAIAAATSATAAAASAVAAASSATVAAAAAGIVAPTSVTDRAVVVFSGTTGTVAAVGTATISADGEMVNTSQPCFIAYPASEQTNVPSITTTVLFGTEVVDQGDNFASSTFTAPVTGRYLLSLFLKMSNIDLAASYTIITIVTSNRAQRIWQTQPQFDITADCDVGISGACIADMDANDTAHVTIAYEGGAEQVDITTDSRFSGALLN